MNAFRQLTLTEELFFWDDRPAYPCACFFRVAFRGNLDRLALEAAIGRTLLRYPLLCSKTQFDSQGRLHWLVPEQPRVMICWDQAAEGRELPKARRIDLSVETGIRFYAASGGDRSVLVIQYHHACSDALGVMRFLRDLLAAYNDPSAPVPSISQEPGGPQRRNRWWWPPSRIPGALRRSLLLARRRPVPLIPGKPPSPDASLHEDYPSAVWQTLNPTETDLLIRAASRQKVTVNDLLLRDLLLALAESRGSNGITGQEGWMRIMVPRLSENARASPGTTLDPVSALFLDVHTKDIASPGLLLQIHREMMVRKRACDEDLRRKAAALERRLGGDIARHVRANKCLVTTVFSNLGKVPIKPPQPSRSSKSLALESVHGVHVVRLYAPLNFMVMTLAGSLSLTMSFDSRMILHAEAEKLFRGLLGKIHDSAHAVN